MKQGTLLKLLSVFFVAAFTAFPSHIIKLDFPERAQLSIKEALPPEASSLQIAFKPPPDMPAKTFVTIYTKDWDSLWRQIRIPFPKNNRISVPLAGQASATAWKPMGHGRPWNSAARVVEYGVIIEPGFGEKDIFKGELEVTEIKPVHGKGLKERPSVLSERHSGSLPAGGTWEADFMLSCWPTDPFDPVKTDITAKIKTPGGTVETVKGFYYEPFLYDEEQWDKTRCLTPWGSPSFKVRYCPGKPGLYQADITAKIDGVDFKLDKMSFEVSENASYRGFVRIDEKNPLYFKYDDGTVFTGIGMNVRSPYDNRYRDVAPFSPWQDQGLSVYSRLFRKYRECGINVVEVWMCSWWLALEWINDAPGFHGVGYYNQYRAWMLDYIMELARQNGIYVILVINNHGKFAMHFDTEWKRNPYNVKNGGYLEKCEQYYSNARAKKDTKKLLDYIVARWSATPNLLSWKLFTELDLTGPDIEYYRRTPDIANWHAEMGDYLKKIDLYRHPVTTHWMLNYQRIDGRTAGLKQLDFLTTDVYYNLGAGTAGMMRLMDGSRAFAKRQGKPLIITEYGGSSYADHMGNLVKQVPAGIWFGYFNEMSIVPMYWWFALVEDRDIYAPYSALSSFAAGEDRRKMTLAVKDTGKQGLQMRAMQGDSRTLAWIYDRGYFNSQKENAQPAAKGDVSISLPVKFSGKCRIELWSTSDGMISTADGIAKNGAAEVLLPAFCRDAAVKIIKSE